MVLFYMERYVMETERVLSLDISSKTGWSLLVISKEGYALEAYGQIPPIPEPIGVYPGNYVDWALMCYGKIVELIDEHAPDTLVIEETSKGSKNAYSQKILEYIHYNLAKLIKETGIKAVYMLTEQWRRETGCKMSKAEKDKNKEVRDYKKKNNNTKVAYNKEGKRIGITGRKHVNVRRANEVFGKFLSKPLIKSQEDTADSLLLGYAYYLRQVKNGENYE